MHEERAAIEARVRRVLDERIRPAQTSTVCALEVAAWHVTGPDGIPGHGEPVAPEVALAATYTPFRVGRAWGPPWGTSWFRLRAQVPAELRDRHLEAVVDLGWHGGGPGFQAEGLVFDREGQVVKGLAPMSAWIPVQLSEKGRFRVYVEAAANPSIPLGTPSPLGDKATAGTEPLYTLRRADLVEVRVEVRELVADIVALLGVVAGLPDDSHRAWQVLLALDEAVDVLDLADVPGTAGASRAVLAPALGQPAAASAHRISAVGHAHLDTAWLWPVRETRRKVARTVANVLALAESDPGLVFALPAAQHCAWLEQDHPALFERLCAAVADGVVVPVGSMWVEPDGNLPGGEAVCRQLTFGARYFAERFGVRCDGMWLPDSFGYSAALPQLADLAGLSWMLTQKLSWNETNRFPHHTFAWEGLDGTRLFTHFPPADTYNSDLSGPQLAHAASGFADKGRSDRSLLPFGYGDGGGGPTREMLAQARRVADLDGSPRVAVESPSAFVDRARRGCPEPAVWVGELYLERHRGTFTTQALTKRGNRRNEHLLREAELWSATAAVRGLLGYPYDRLDRLWREVLLAQFHDILPGSSIAWVHADAEALHERVAGELDALIERAQSALAGSLDVEGEVDGEIDDEPEPHTGSLQEATDLGLVRFDANPLAAPGQALAGTAYTLGDDEPVTVVAAGTVAVLDNGMLRVSVDARGLVTSMRDLVADRELLPPGELGNVLRLHQDFPRAWDAWDLDASHRGSVRELTEVEELEVEPDDDGTARLLVRRRHGDSRFVQTLVLAPRERALHVRVDVDWHERDTLLRLAWPLDVHTDHARYETQFGHVVRSTHENTSWDAARFEVPAHRWVHIGEPGFGVAVANERTYGWSLERRARRGGGTFTTVAASLLRGPQSPDPHADEGAHTFGFRLVPGASVWDAVATGYAVNLPSRLVPGRAGPLTAPLVTVAGGAVLEAVKLADDRSGDVVLRLYEPLGARARATVSTSFPLATATECDLHEQPRSLPPADAAVLGVHPTGSDAEGTGEIALGLRPFQVLTLRLAVSAANP